VYTVQIFLLIYLRKYIISYRIVSYWYRINTFW